LYLSFDGIQMIAEESTSFPMVSRPTFLGGLGFSMKWMMGWMHDTIEYFSKEPIYRRFHQNDVTFSMNYAFTENFMLPLSHDEVVYGKQSMIYKMPGDEWQRFGNLRALYSYMFTHPGAKLLFMGAEFGQTSEWNFQQSLDWHLLEYGFHSGMKNLISDLNKLYRSEPALYEKQFSHEGFEWINHNDYENSCMSYIRKGNNPEEDLYIVCNFTPILREGYRIGVNKSGKLTEVFNSDSVKYEGAGNLNSTIATESIEYDGRKNSAQITLPSLGVVVFRLNN
jgi:1,4-alpha-glucan branching enzyme